MSKTEWNFYFIIICFNIKKIFFNNIFNNVRRIISRSNVQLCSIKHIIRFNITMSLFMKIFNNNEIILSRITMQIEFILAFKPICFEIFKNSPFLYLFRESRILPITRGYCLQTAYLSHLTSLESASIEPTIFFFILNISKRSFSIVMEGV